MASKVWKKSENFRRKREIDAEVSEKIKLKIQKVNEKNEFVFSTIINDYNHGSSDFDVSFDKTMEAFLSIKYQHEIITEVFNESKIKEPKKIKRNLVFDGNVRTSLGEWIDGKSVRYAMKYKIGSSYSMLGPWSEPMVIKDYACPILGVPLVPKKFTRLVYRKFDDGEPQLVAILDPETERFRDIDRDIYNLASANESLDKGLMGTINDLIRLGGNASAIFENGRRPIHAAAESGNVQIVKECFRTLDLQVKDDRGFTPLHLAVRSNSDQLIDIFKSDVNSQTDLGLTPLHIAAYEGYGIIVEKLIRRGANITASDKEGFTPFHHAVFNGLYFDSLANTKSGGLTPLHIASISNYDIVEELIEKVDVNAKIHGFTALHLSTLFGNKETLSLLLKKVDVNSKSVYDWTALHFAVALENKELVKVLSEVADLNAKGAGEMTPLHMAVLSRRADIVDVLVDHKAHLDEKTDSGLTPLHIATKLNDKEIVAILIEKGADLNSEMPDGVIPSMVSAQNGYLYPVEKYMDKHGGTARDKNGNTLLHYACVGGNLQIVMYIEEKVKDSVTVKNNEGVTPLHLAVFNGNDQIVEFLTKKSLKDTVDNNGDGLVHYAVKAKRLNTLKYLIDSKHLDVNVLNKKGKSALDIAFINFDLTSKADLDIVLYLAQNDAKDQLGRSALHMAAEKGFSKLVERLGQSVFLNKEDKLGQTPLFKAVIMNHLDIVKYLYFNNDRSMIQHRDNNGRNVIHLAAFHSDLEILKFLESSISINSEDIIKSEDNARMTPLHFAVKGKKLETVEYLVEQGAEVNAYDIESCTPVHYAARDGSLSILKFFAEKTNANMNARTYRNQTPLEIAKENQNRNVVEYLESNKTSGSTETYERLRRSIDIIDNQQLQSIGIIENRPLLAAPSDLKLNISHSIDTNGTLLLFDVLIRKITGLKYACSSARIPYQVEATALEITREFESLMGLGGRNLDFFHVYKEVAQKLSACKFEDVSALLKSYAEKSGIKSKEMNAFLEQIRLPVGPK